MVYVNYSQKEIFLPGQNHCHDGDHCQNSMFNSRLACVLRVSTACFSLLPRTHSATGKVIGVGVFMYIICLYVYGPKIYLNRTLAIDSPF